MVLKFMWCVATATGWGSRLHTPGKACDLMQVNHSSFKEKCFRFLGSPPCANPAREPLGLNWVLIQCDKSRSNVTSLINVSFRFVKTT